MHRVTIFVLTLILAPSLAAQDPPRPLPDLSPAKPPEARGGKLPAHLQPVATSAARGMEWLQRANQPDGKFLPGFIPALAAKAEGEAFLPQAEAAMALLRAAHYERDDRALAIGKQALLRLLQDTTTDAAQPAIRFTAAPEPFVNRLAACGGLLRAIHELPNPPDDLRVQARQLASYLASQIQPDGSFALGVDDAAFKMHLAHTCTGPALAGLAAFETRSPGAAKSDRVLRAAAVYSILWRQSKSPLMIPDHTAAYAESYLAGDDARLAQVVFEMNDWLLTLQYSADPRHPLWAGGFMPWHDGKASNLPPETSSAFYACCLVDACRVAKRAGDAQRLARYRQSLEQTLSFLVTLQYTDARTQHYADWFRPWIVGGFFNHHQDGNIRLANTAQATAAMVGYLQHVAE
jgi:hypothetical protein